MKGGCLSVTQAAMEDASELARTGTLTFGVRLDRARISGMAALPPTAEVSRRGRLGWSVPGTDPRLKTQPAGPGSVGAPRIDPGCTVCGLEAAAGCYPR